MNAEEIRAHLAAGDAVLIRTPSGHRAKVLRVDDDMGHFLVVFQGLTPGTKLSLLFSPEALAERVT